MKQLVYLLLLFLVAAGCKKETNKEQRWLRLTIDGVPTECSRSIQASGNAIRYNNLPTQLLAVSGGWNQGATRGDVELELFGYKNTTGEWTLDAPSRATLWLETKTSTGALVSETYHASGNEAKMAITQVDDNYIKGSFSFVAYTNQGPGLPLLKKTVTGGEFHIRRNP